ncbi:MAG: TlpA family protein disulfide reductase [Magnetococcales bacterium]|nr:TlpA family protein disulfide reductase [Magnetococcales bacterium]
MNTPLATTDGKTMRLSDLKGKVVLINFWATWCPPCLEEIPALVQLQTQYADRGLVVVGIDYMEKADAKRLNQFIDEQGINYPVVMGELKTLQGVAKILGGVFALPVTKVLDRSGKVAASHIGGLDLAEMKKLVEPLL